ncbi:uncharacterized protein LOC118756644 [Rhagoletis pomonella]|uniref:uncharacterized protein LOC118756644 n=1 Tax=Rhagoletis pomonella TaxID=28610 RepID=UPI00177EA903|nr:uncharacterized protein LOC118756644 [Rhagoletis pomonella]
MYFCFVCEYRTETVKKLISHFNSEHKLKNFAVYKCAQKNCLQHFSSKWSFAKHLNRHEKYANDDNLSLNNVKSNSESFNNTDRSSYNCTKPESHICKTDNNPNDKIIGSAVIFSCELYSKNYLSSSIQKNVSNICKILVANIKDTLKNEIDIPLTNKLREVFKLCSDPLQYVNTEYKFFKYIQSKNLFHSFSEHTINNEIVPRIRLGNPTLAETNSKAYITPLRFQFKKNFELKSLLRKTLNNTQFLQNQTQYSNFVNGSIFKSKEQKIGKGKLIIPYFLYSDDFETNNPLGSHTTKDSIRGCYYSFPTIPQYLLSSLEFILLSNLVI